MIKHIIQITIVGDTKGEQCDAHCGIDWFAIETVTLANQRIKDRFGDKIQLEYLDLAKPMANRHALEVKQSIKDKNPSFPLLLINGKPRISGPFDIRQLLDAIDAEMEIESQS